MTDNYDRRYEITVVEHATDGSTRELVGGRCSALVLATCADVKGELRILIVYGGPTTQSRKAIRSLTER
jgi:hypothetical protein